MGSHDDVLTVARANMDAFNQGDSERLRGTLAVNAVYREFATGREIRGQDEVTKAGMGWRDAFPDARGEITNAFSAGEQGVFQITWTGTHKGDLVSPAGTIPATGKRVNVPACQVIQVREGKIAVTDHYFDLMTMLVQLGVTAAQPTA